MVERTLVTTLTKKMAEDLTKYLTENGIRVRYMHSAFHFFVLAGSGCHLVAVWYILAGI